MSCITDTRTLVRFIENCLKVTKSGDTLFCSDKLCLSNFFQSIDTFSFDSFVIGATGGTGAISRDMNFMYVAVDWPSSALESEKTLELQVSNFDYVGGTGPLGATGLSSEKVPLKDLYITNSSIDYKELFFTNKSKHIVTLNVFTAKD
jgi:hypothetical protein